MAGVLDTLLEGFAAPAVDPFPHHPFTMGDHVRVAVKGAQPVVGRVVRPHGGPPPTHAVVAPEGGGAHVLAPVGTVKLATPAQHATVVRQRQQAEAQQAKGGLVGAQRKPVDARGVVREGVSVLLEAFKPPETVAQSQVRGAQQVAQAKQQLSAGWNASKHPRGQGGKFGYTTGGKRATRGRKASSRTVGVGARGALVKSVQRQLHIPADGIYGPQTKAAVTRYQQQHGLQVDGVIGRQTLAALRGHTNPRSVKPGAISSRSAAVLTHPVARKPRAARPPKVAKVKAPKVKPPAPVTGTKTKPVTTSKAKHPKGRAPGAAAALKPGAPVRIAGGVLV